ncbi:MAG: poly-gamma-glutamate capsule biosynthesis protein CapA/YwtB (metallophosphatase superfamily), partial [Planctomycetaceae bacterium]
DSPSSELFTSTLVNFGNAFAGSGSADAADGTTNATTTINERRTGMS